VGGADARRVAEPQRGPRARVLSAQRKRSAGGRDLERTENLEFQSPRLPQRGFRSFAELDLTPAHRQSSCCEGVRSGKLGLQAGDHHLKEALGPIETLESVLAEVAKRNAVRQVLFDEPTRHR